MKNKKSQSTAGIASNLPRVASLGEWLADWLRSKLNAIAPSLRFCAKVWKEQAPIITRIRLQPLKFTDKLFVTEF